MEGYTNSKTWEAWVESWQVYWDNTSFLFIISIMSSIVVAAATWVIAREAKKPCSQATANSLQEGNVKVSDDEEENKDEKDLLNPPESPAEVMKAHRRALEESIETQMSDEQRREEREAQSQQLAAIFKLMQEQEEKFGETTFDELKDQMKLYCG